MAVFKPGDIVPESGIYSVLHDNNHRLAHEVTCIRDRKFPPCRNCEQPRFKLKHAAIHISDHPAFSR
jgi:hypothetical protein